MSQPPSEWVNENVPDLTGKTYLVTGANSGLGFEISNFLAIKGASVWLAGRREEEIDKAIAKIKAATNNEQLSKLIFDLADLNSVNQAANHFLEKDIALDGLINNAGVMAIPYSNSKQGYELQFAINHLGHFLLTQKLLPQLEKKGARIVNMSSFAYLSASGKVRAELSESEYARFPRYAETKHYNVLFSAEFNRRAAENNIRTKAYIAHPGLSSTNLFPVPGIKNNKLLMKVVHFFVRGIGQSAAMGSLGAILAATAPNAETDKIYGPTDSKGRPGQKGFPVGADLEPHRLDKKAAKKLWNLSLELTKNYAN